MSICPVTCGMSSSKKIQKKSVLYRFDRRIELSSNSTLIVRGLCDVPWRVLNLELGNLDLWPVWLGDVLYFYFTRCHPGYIWKFSGKLFIISNGIINVCLYGSNSHIQHWLNTCVAPNRLQTCISSTTVIKFTGQWAMFRSASYSLASYR